MAETLNRAVDSIGMDPTVALAQRSEAVKRVVDIKERLANYRSMYRGGTASPYDQLRKAFIARLVSELRNSAEGKISETRLDSEAHASDEYKKWLEHHLARQRDMHLLEAELEQAEQDVAEWDRYIDIVRTLLHWSASEMRMTQ
ncbi:MAG: hypothetical protein AMS18_00175 [Gemmatimonas sp. SG8_17]|nr:MAG: hypothetical protein AMS18_00175 [Gemmatimonas sp. SG8_17]